MSAIRVKVGDLTSSSTCVPSTSRTQVSTMPSSENILPLLSTPDAPPLRAPSPPPCAPPLPPKLGPYISAPPLPPGKPSASSTSSSSSSASSSSTSASKCVAKPETCQKVQTRRQAENLSEDPAWRRGHFLFHFRKTESILQVRARDKEE